MTEFLRFNSFICLADKLIMHPQSC